MDIFEIHQENIFKLQYPLEHQYYVAKLWFTGGHIYFFAPKHRLSVPTIIVLSKYIKISNIFSNKIFIFYCLKNPYIHCGMGKFSQLLRKLAHAINREFSSFKIENFQPKKFDIFLIFAQNIDCGNTLEPPRRGGSNEYPQPMFWSKNKKKGIPLHTPVLLYKSGVEGGIYCTDMFS